MRRGLNFVLLVSFIATILVPLTGVYIHKLASVVFLLLCVVHTVLYRKGLGKKRYLLLGLIFVSFVSGLFGMIWEQSPGVLIGHRVLSIGVVFFLAIHVFVYHRKLRTVK